MSGAHHHDHGHNPEHKPIALAISIIAVVLAIITTLAKESSDKMIVNEVKASNGYAWYQAKRLRAHLNDLEIERINAALVGNPTESQRQSLEKFKLNLIAKNAEYKTENDDILKESRVFETKAKKSAHQAHGFERAETFLHIAVVLCSVTLLTNRKIFAHSGIVLACLGTGLALWAYVSEPPSEHGDPVQPKTSQTQSQ